MNRLDILIYAHDGRGLGHVSRGAAIGMALRRLFPRLRVLLVTGCRFTQELIGAAPLDWLKLPAYETTVVAGKSVGRPGNSLYSDQQQGLLRGELIARLFSLYRPRAVLVDHAPQGKHRELLPALELSASWDTVWILGVRAVVGEVPQLNADFARKLYAERYRELFYYGDVKVLGADHIDRLSRRFGAAVRCCGYVSRLSELLAQQQRDRGDSRWAGTIALPWLGERSDQLVNALAGAMERIAPEHGRWRLFIDSAAAREVCGGALGRLVAQPHCIVEPPGAGYLDALLASRCALVYGGYNSLLDVIVAGKPAVVVMREMADREQQDHLARLKSVMGDRLLAVQESAATPETLVELLLRCLAAASEEPFPSRVVDTGGAAGAAGRLNELLERGGAAQ